jgi:hypothetical protein
MSTPRPPITVDHDAKPGDSRPLLALLLKLMRRNEASDFKPMQRRPPPDLLPGPNLDSPPVNPESVLSTPGTNQGGRADT